MFLMSNISMSSVSMQDCVSSDEDDEVFVKKIDGKESMQIVRIDTE